MLSKVKKKIERRFKELYLDVRRPSVNAIKNQLVAEGYDLEVIEQVMARTLSARPSEVKIIEHGVYDSTMSRLVSVPRDGG